MAWQYKSQQKTHSTSPQYRPHTQPHNKDANVKIYTFNTFSVTISVKYSSQL